MPWEASIVTLDAARPVAVLASLQLGDKLIEEVVEMQEPGNITSTWTASRRMSIFEWPCRRSLAEDPTPGRVCTWIT